MKLASITAQITCPYKAFRSQNKHVGVPETKEYLMRQNYQFKNISIIKKLFTGYSEVFCCYFLN